MVRENTPTITNESRVTPPMAAASAHSMRGDNHSIASMAVNTAAVASKSFCPRISRLMCSARWSSTIRSRRAARVDFSLAICSTRALELTASAASMVLNSPEKNRATTRAVPITRGLI